MCELLLKYGADLGISSCSGRSALFTAVEHNHIGVVEVTFLFLIGLVVQKLCKCATTENIIAQTHGGISSFMLAENRNNTQMINLMLSVYKRCFDVNNPQTYHPYLTAMLTKMEKINVRESALCRQFSNISNNLKRINEKSRAERSSFEKVNNDKKDPKFKKELLIRSLPRTVSDEEIMENEIHKFLFN